MSDDLIRVFIGYDPREAATFHVLAHSIHSRSSRPVTIAPLMLSQLKKEMWRERHPLQSTDFSFSRFLVPSLCDFEGWALFMDSDMVMLEDISKLWDMRDDKYAVMCVKHDHVPTQDTKFLNEKQTKYEKKNWSSVMLLNCAKCKALTTEYVNEASGLELHRFHWLGNDDLIGEIPMGWNHLVDYNDPEPIENLSNIHYTDGGPYFESYKDCGYADVWWNERDRMLHTDGDK